jgi:hypothetical protein
MYLGSGVLCIFVLKALITLLVPDVPDSVRIAVAKERWRMEENIKYDEKRQLAAQKGVTVEALDGDDDAEDFSTDDEQRQPSSQPTGDHR